MIGQAAELSARVVGRIDIDDIGLGDVDGAPQPIFANTLPGAIMVEGARFAHTIDELYDVAVLPRARAPEEIGFKSDGIEREIVVE